MREAASSRSSEAKVLIPRDKLRVLGDHTHADDIGPSRSGLPESVPNEFSTETAPALLGRYAKPFQVCHRG